LDKSLFIPTSTAIRFKLPPSFWIAHDKNINHEVLSLNLDILAEQMPRGLPGANMSIYGLETGGGNKIKAYLSDMFWLLLYLQREVKVCESLLLTEIVGIYGIFIGAVCFKEDICEPVCVHMGECNVLMQKNIPSLHVLKLLFQFTEACVLYGSLFLIKILRN
jgi:hypothetical protein